MEKAISPELELPEDFHAFLSIAANKIALKQLLGEDLIAHAPENKTIVVSGAFQDPLDIRSSVLTLDLTGLVSDHSKADTRIILIIPL